jgi:uncharacterized OB-fold protein
MLRASFKLEYAYKRSTGKIIKKFFTFLANKKLSGSTFSNGDIFVPALEFHPETREPAIDVIDLNEKISLLNWTWIASPKKYHPIQKPFAYGLIQVGNSRTSMLHIITDCNESDLHKDIELVPIWKQDAGENMKNLAYFKVNG